MHHCRPLRITFIVLLGLASLTAQAQEKCMTHQLRPLDREFEDWMRANLVRASDRRNGRDYDYTIPVVVHIVHKGESLGTGSNLSEKQILSQIKVLNNDFQRLNADTSQTPVSFHPIAGKIRIQFVLAKQDPDGRATTGITRRQGAKKLWSLDDEVSLKVNDYWPAEDYLNIWVADLADPVLGYAQFPVSSSLPGLDFAFDDRETDGVVLDYRAFGTSDDGTFSLYSGSTKGRTTTHEVGHFLGLRHIWGDDDSACGAPGDYVEDTPDQSGPSNGCPTHPTTTCGVPKMFQNYMDYTNDRCMNIFTAGQINRMLTVLENGKRRNSLTVSPGLSLPDPVPNDIEITSISAPRLSECSPEITPSIIVRNAGSNEITTFTIRYTIDDKVQSKTFSVNLAAGASMTVEFSSETVVSGTGHTIAFLVISANNSTDPTLLGNTISTTFRTESRSAYPFSESFYNLPTTWTIINPDGKKTWNTRQAPRDVEDNTAMYLKYHGDVVVGQPDTLISPVITFIGKSAALLFDVAYAMRMDQSDRLKVLLVKDCAPRAEAIEIFNRSGNDLATAPSSINEFIPSSLAEWRRELIDLSEFDITSSVQIIFVGISNGGNNLYVDNIRVVDSPTTDLALLSVTKPYPVQCSDEVTARVKVRNVGLEPIHSFQLVYSVNDNVTGSRQISGFPPVAPDTEAEIDLEPITILDIENVVSFELTEPNDLIDVNMENNAALRHVVIDTTADIIPIRENFESGAIPTGWKNVNSSIGPTWELITLEGNSALRMKGSSDLSVANEIWFASPRLDLTNVGEASFFFDYSTLQPATDPEERDALSVGVSRDCGNTYEIVHDISLVSSSAGQWQTAHVPLTIFAGEAELLVALIAKKKSSHDLLIDNLEFYTQENPERSFRDMPYALYGNDLLNEDFFITFNLYNRQDVECEMIDIAGRNVFSETFKNVLNQTFRLEFPAMARGVYVVRLRVGETYYTTRICL